VENYLIHEDTGLQLKRHKYLSTGNPITAWEYFKACREQGEPIPEEVLRYFDTVADGILKVAADPPEPKKRPERLAKALGMLKKTRGAGSCFDAYKNRLKGFRIAKQTEALLEAEDAGEDWTFKQVAKENALSKSTVMRRYKGYRGRLRNEVDHILKMLK